MQDRLADGITPPSGNKVLAEAMAVFQIPRLVLRTPRLLGGPRGAAQTVMFIPGLKASDVSTLPLRRYLDQRGFRTRGWGLGTNTGQVGDQLEELVVRVIDLYDEVGEPIHLVGWSLGGFLAREVARRHPEVVAQVITYGTPVVGGPLYTSVTGVYSPEERLQIAADVDERNKTPITVPITALHSRNDGIVAWRACIDTFSPQVENIEVQSPHIGMGIDPDVWEIVTERLAR